MQAPGHWKSIVTTFQIRISLCLHEKCLLYYNFSRSLDILDTIEIEFIYIQESFSIFQTFLLFCRQLSNILKQLYFSMENDLRTESFKHKYDYFPIFWHLDRTLKRTVVFSAQFIFKMAASINASVVHLIYSFTQSCSRIPVESCMPSRGIPISILINVLTRTK